MELKNKKLVIFDFDGVLVNTINFCFDIHKNNNPNFTIDEFRSMSDGNFIEGVNKMKKNRDFIVKDDFYDKYVDKIGEINIQDILKNTIKSIYSKYIIIIISSTPTKLIYDFLIKENTQDYFKDILGSDVNKSKVVKIKSALEKYNINPEDAVFITDSLGDVLDGNECKIKSIGVTWGIHDRKTLEKGNPAVIIDDPRDLLKTIEGMLK